MLVQRLCLLQQVTEDAPTKKAISTKALTVFRRIIEWSEVPLHSVNLGLVNSLLVEPDNLLSLGENIPQESDLKLFMLTLDRSINNMLVDLATGTIDGKKIKELKTKLDKKFVIAQLVPHTDTSNYELLHSFTNIFPIEINSYCIFLENYIEFLIFNRDFESVVTKCIKKLGDFLGWLLQEDDSMHGEGITDKRLTDEEVAAFFKCHWYCLIAHYQLQGFKECLHLFDELCLEAPCIDRIKRKIKKTAQDSLALKTHKVFNGVTGLSVLQDLSNSNFCIDEIRGIIVTSALLYYDNIELAQLAASEQFSKLMETGEEDYLLADLLDDWMNGDFRKFNHAWQSASSQPLIRGSPILAANVEFLSRCFFQKQLVCVFASAFQISADDLTAKLGKLPQDKHEVVRIANALNGALKLGFRYDGVKEVWRLAEDQEEAFDGFFRDLNAMNNRVSLTNRCFQLSNSLRSVVDE